jgi:hypothetical protein
MSIVKPRELTRSDKSAEIEGNIRNLGQQSSTVRQPEGTSKQASTLVREISLASTREIDRLIGDLKDLRDKLENDSNRIQAEIIEHASLSESAVQLTKIVSDSVAHVKGMSDAPSVSAEAVDSIIPTPRTKVDVEDPPLF